jgi:hypothetical protein
MRRFWTLSQRKGLKMSLQDAQIGFKSCSKAAMSVLTRQKRSWLRRRQLCYLLRVAQGKTRKWKMQGLVLG